MKEKLYTIPLNDAVNAGDECPFCYVEKELEQDQLDFVLGACASYMESDVREMTDKEGFCRAHFKKMYDYGNTLGNAWILKTHYVKMRAELNTQIEKFKPGKVSISDKLLKKVPGNSIANWVKEKENSCFICKRNKEIFDRYIDTFFILYNNEAEFREKIKNSKGFCISHFGTLMENADIKMNDTQRQELYNILFPLMEKNMDRLQEDVDWMVEKFDYRNADADWKNSKDAVPRGMQKLMGGYPSDDPYKMKK